MSKWFLAILTVTLISQNLYAQDEEDSQEDSPIQTEEAFFEATDESEAQSTEASEETEESRKEKQDDLSTTGESLATDEPSDSDKPSDFNEPEDVADQDPLGESATDEDSIPIDDNEDIATDASTEEDIEYDPSLAPESIPENEETLPKVRRRKPKLATDPFYKRQRIKHPNAKKGLFLITKDKEYFYRVKRSKASHSASVKAGAYNPSNLKNTESGVSFSDIYNSAGNIMIIVDYEWFYWKGFGQLNYKVGGGVFVATGNGRFSPTSVNKDLTPPENFTLLMFPASAGLIYHMKYWDKQWLIPYGEGGADLIGFTEIRDDSKGPKFGGSLAAHVAGGLSFSLSNYSRLTMIELDREYGINDIRLNFEFRALFPLAGNFDFTGNIISGGISASF